MSYCSCVVFFCRRFWRFFIICFLSPSCVVRCLHLQFICLQSFILSLGPCLHPMCLAQDTSLYLCYPAGMLGSAGPVELIAGGAYASRARGSSDTAHRSVSPSLADLCICTSSISISFVFYSYKAIIQVGRFTVSGISL